jgi:hypothetical protein
MNASQPGYRVHKTTRSMLDVRGFIPVRSSNHSASHSTQTLLGLTQTVAKGIGSSFPRNKPATMLNGTDIQGLESVDLHLIPPTPHPT